MNLLKERMAQVQTENFYSVLMLIGLAYAITMAGVVAIMFLLD